MGILNLTEPVLPPDYQINIVSRIDNFIQKDVLIRTIDLCQNEQISGIIGAAYSSTSEIINLAASSYNVPQVM